MKDKQNTDPKQAKSKSITVHKKKLPRNVCKANSLCSFDNFFLNKCP